MINVTENVLRQSSDFGRPVRMNITRVDNYVSKFVRIFQILKEDEVNIRVEAGAMLVEKRQLNLAKAKKLVRWYGRRFFMNICYRNDGTVVFKLIGVAPQRDGAEDDESDEDDEK